MEDRNLRATSIAGSVKPESRPCKSVRGVLEWAFGTECAQLEFDEFDHVAPGVSTTAIACDMLAISPEGHKGITIAIDVSRGRSYPHEDADAVASLVASYLPRHLAVMVADNARAATCPQWDLGQQRIQPIAWKQRNQYGQEGREEVLRTIRYKWRGRKWERKETWVPCVWVPSASEIARKRREYLSWWGSLAMLAPAFAAMEFHCFDFVDRMPPMQPWKKTC